MRHSLVILATIFLAMCGALVIVAPAMGKAESTRADTVPHEPRIDMVTFEAERSAFAAGGCKSVASFTSSAAPELQKDACVGCHSGPTAKGAFDLSSIGTDNAAACAQALTKVNLANKAQSIIIRAPTGTHPHMGGKVEDTQAFTAAVLGWMNNE